MEKNYINTKSKSIKSLILNYLKIIDHLQIWMLWKSLLRNSPKLTVFIKEVHLYMFTKKVIIIRLRLSDYGEFPQ